MAISFYQGRLIFAPESCPVPFAAFIREVFDGILGKIRPIRLHSFTVIRGQEHRPTGNFVASPLQSVAQLDNNVRRERSMSGMKVVLANGGWPWLAQLGFLNGASAQPPLIHDPEHAPQMAALFSKIAEGNRLQHAIE
jgi:hypothetical protein